MSKKSFQCQMQDIVDHLGVCLTVAWMPDESKSVKGELKGKFIYIYDEEQAEALATLTHEIIEFKLKALTRVYRSMINSLIEGYEKLAYQEKEEFIEFIQDSFKQKLIMAPNSSNKLEIPK